MMIALTFAALALAVLIAAYGFFGLLRRVLTGIAAFCWAAAKFCAALESAVEHGQRQFRREYAEIRAAAEREVWR